MSTVERLSVGESWAEVGPPEERQSPLPLPYHKQQSRRVNLPSASHLNNCSKYRVSGAIEGIYSASHLMLIKGGTQIRTGDKGFAILCLTTWPCRRSGSKTPNIGSYQSPP